VISLTTIIKSDSHCPICGAEAKDIAVFDEPYWDEGEWKSREKIFCKVCGYDESQQSKFEREE